MIVANNRTVAPLNRIFLFFILFLAVTGLPGNLLGWSYIHLHSTVPNDLVATAGPQPVLVRLHAGLGVFRIFDNRMEKPDQT